MKIQFLIFKIEKICLSFEESYKTEMPPLLTAFHPKIKIENFNSEQ